jgi:hypothetical protein
MKKFGTPIGAGPGNAKLKVGFEEVGTPPAPRIGPGFAGGGVLVVEPLPPDVEPLPEPAGFFCCGGPPPVWEDGCCEVPGPRVRGGGCDEVPVPVPVVEVGGAEVLVLGVDEVGVDEVGVGAGGGEEAHDSEMDAIGRWTGSEIDDSGVPGGTFTVKLSFPPPTSVTVITHVSADAAGSAATADTASTVPTVAAAIPSLRLLNTVA